MCCMNPKKKCIHGEAGVEISYGVNPTWMSTLRALVDLKLRGERGPVQIRSFDPDQLSKEYSKVTDAWSAGKQSVVSVLMMGYQVPILTITPDHPVLTKTRGVIEVGTLKRGDFIASPTITGDCLEFVEIDRIDDAPACEVFGLELENRLWFAASGILVGSLKKK